MLETVLKGDPVCRFAIPHPKAIRATESILLGGQSFAHMRHQFRLPAIIGSQEKNGNSYCLAKIVPDSLPVSYKTIQSAEANIDIVHDVSNARTAMIVVLRMISNPTLGHHHCSG